MAELRDNPTDELDEELRCPECGALMGPDDEVCPQCGAEFAFYCPDCGQQVDADATICPNCGAELDEGIEDETDTEIVEGEVGSSSERPALNIPRATRCTNCGEPIGPEDEECPTCGADLCPDCGTALSTDDAVCPTCGAEFVFSCPNCDQDVPVNADVCPHCHVEFEKIELENE